VVALCLPGCPSAYMIFSPLVSFFFIKHRWGPNFICPRHVEHSSVPAPPGSLSLPRSQTAGILITCSPQHSQAQLRSRAKCPLSPLRYPPQCKSDSQVARAKKRKAFVSVRHNMDIPLLVSAHDLVEK
jgi:hypothetical protein